MSPRDQTDLFDIYLIAMNDERVRKARHDLDNKTQAIVLATALIKRANSVKAVEAYSSKLIDLMELNHKATLEYDQVRREVIKELIAKEVLNESKTG